MNPHVHYILYSSWIFPLPKCTCWMSLSPPLMEVWKVDLCPKGFSFQYSYTSCQNLNYIICSTVIFASSLLSWLISDHQLLQQFFYSCSFHDPPKILPAAQIRSSCLASSCGMSVWCMTCMLWMVTMVSIILPMIHLYASDQRVELNSLDKLISPIGIVHDKRLPSPEQLPHIS